MDCLAAAICLLLFAMASGETGDITAYSSNWQGGQCGFTTIPSSTAATYFAAINDPQWDNSLNCGRCVQLTYNSKSLIVYVLNRCPECKEGDYDLSIQAYKFLTEESPGRKSGVESKFVTCPSDYFGGQNVKVYTKDGSNPYWAAFQPVNMQNPVTQISLSQDGGNTWRDLPLCCSGNFFNFSGGGQLSSYKLKLTGPGSAEVIVDMNGVTAGSFTDSGRQN